MSVAEIYDKPVDLIPKEISILVYPDKRLYNKSEDITRFDDEVNNHLIQLFGDMTLTMVNNNGIGISAPQIGIFINMIVILTQQPTAEKPEPYALINPIIKESEGEFEWEEGCLSVPGYFEKRNRAKKIVVEFKNLAGEYKEIEFHGLYAFIVQHEIDHLNGKLFIDNLSNLKKKFSIEKKIKKFLKTK